MMKLQDYCSGGFNLLRLSESRVHSSAGACTNKYRGINDALGNKNKYPLMTIQRYGIEHIKIQH